MIKGQLNKAIKSTKAFHEYQETKTKMNKEDILDQVGMIIWAVIVFGIPIICAVIL